YTTVCLPPCHTRFPYTTLFRSLAGMWGMYPEAVELLKQAHYCKCLNCPVAVDALPQATSVFDLAKEGKRDSKSAQAEEEILKARGDFNATPTLFETSKTSVKTRP